MNVCVVQVLASFALLVNARRQPVLLVLQPLCALLTARFSTPCSSARRLFPPSHPARSGCSFLAAGVLGHIGASRCKPLLVAAHVMGSAGLSVVFMIFLLASTFFKQVGTASLAPAPPLRSPCGPPPHTPLSLSGGCGPLLHRDQLPARPLPTLHLGRVDLAVPRSHQAALAAQRAPVASLPKLRPPLEAFSPSPPKASRLAACVAAEEARDSGLETSNPRPHHLFAVARFEKTSRRWRAASPAPSTPWQRGCAR